MVGRQVRIGIIGGSGLYQMEGLTRQRQEEVVTPFGSPSDVFMIGQLDGVEVAFLPRHGRDHRVSPSEVNYRANIYGMKSLGVEAIFSVSAVGSLREDIHPMDFVIIDQFIDRTRGVRDSTFFSAGLVAHAAFADPVSPELTEILILSCAELGLKHHRRGTYVCMEGPQFSTRAESRLYRSWGMDVIGMTNLTEAKLAREAEISYATLAAVTDYDCWHETDEAVSVEMILEYLRRNANNAMEILRRSIPKAAALPSFSAADAMCNAFVTSPLAIPENVKRDLRPIIGKYFHISG
jgi:5'-methylthioadenosine phosphorylase